MIYFILSLRHKRKVWFVLVVSVVEYMLTHLSHESVEVCEALLVSVLESSVTHSNYPLTNTIKVGPKKKSTRGHSKNT